MEERSHNGPLHGQEEHFYSGIQELAMEEVARYWLMLQTADKIVDQPHVLRGIKRLEGGKIVLNRTDKAIHTISWGPKIMAQCVPMQCDFLISPDQGNGIG